MSSIEKFLQDLILTIHRRNGGRLESVDFSFRLLDPGLLLDSLDLAEIMAAIEKQYGRSPFDSPEAPRTWADIGRFLGRIEVPPQ
jgi:acyl carrier protein